MRAGQGLQIPIRRQIFQKLWKRTPEYARKEEKDTEHGGVMLSRKPIKNRKTNHRIIDRYTQIHLYWDGRIFNRMTKGKKKKTNHNPIDAKFSE